MGSSPMQRDVAITSEPVELYKILKFEGIASSGAEAKNLIADGQIKVNGSVETRKRKKMYRGDVIAFADELIRLVYNA